MHSVKSQIEVSDEVVTVQESARLDTRPSEKARMTSLDNALTHLLSLQLYLVPNNEDRQNLSGPGCNQYIT